MISLPLHPMSIAAGMPECPSSNVQRMEDFTEHRTQVL